MATSLTSFGLNAVSLFERLLYWAERSKAIWPQHVCSLPTLNPNNWFYLQQLSATMMKTVKRVTAAVMEKAATSCE